MNFPTAGARVYYNEAGEPLDWDYPSYDAPDPDDDYDSYVPEDDDDEDQAAANGYFSRPEVDADTAPTEAEAEADLWLHDPRLWRR